MTNNERQRDGIRRGIQKLVSTYELPETGGGGGILG